MELFNRQHHVIRSAWRIAQRLGAGDFHVDFAHFFAQQDASSRLHALRGPPVCRETTLNSMTVDHFGRPNNPHFALIMQQGNKSNWPHGESPQVKRSACTNKIRACNTLASACGLLFCKLFSNHRESVALLAFTHVVYLHTVCNTGPVVIGAFVLCANHDPCKNLSLFIRNKICLSFFGKRLC